MMDEKGENFYKVIISKNPIQYCIENIGSIVYCSTCPTVAIAKKSAKDKLEELGVIFQKEIRFKKHESIRKKVYQQTRKTRSG